MKRRARLRGWQLATPLRAGARRRAGLGALLSVAAAASISNRVGSYRISPACVLISQRIVISKLAIHFWRGRRGYRQETTDINRKGPREISSAYRLLRPRQSERTGDARRHQGIGRALIAANIEEIVAQAK